MFSTKQKNKIIEKAKQLKTTILHTGKTETIDGVKILNVGEFLIEQNY